MSFFDWITKSDNFGPILTTAVGTAGLIFASKAKNDNQAEAEAAGDKAFEQQKELMRLQAELQKGLGGGGGGGGQTLDPRTYYLAALQKAADQSMTASTNLTNQYNNVGAGASRALISSIR